MILSRASESFAATQDFLRVAIANDGQYQVDEEALRLLAKLGKGRTLIARILEQELLPPNAVQPFIPIILGILLPLNAKKGEAQGSTIDLSTERTFRAITGVLKKLNTPSLLLLKCLEVVHFSSF